MKNIKKKFFLISGDPNSINSEIIYKSWLKLNNSIRDRLYIISNYNLIKANSKNLNIVLKLKKYKTFRRK